MFQTASNAVDLVRLLGTISRSTLRPPITFLRRFGSFERMKFTTVALLVAAPLASSLDVDQLLRKRQRGARRVQAEEEVLLDVELGSMSMDQTQTNGGAHSSKSSKNSKKGGDVPIPPCVFANPALAVSSIQINCNETSSSSLTLG